MFETLFFCDASAFKNAIFPALVANIMPNNMILGMTAAAAHSAEPNPDFVGLVLQRRGNFVGAAASTKPGWLMLSVCDAQCIAPLFEAWINAHGKPAHVFAPEPTITLTIHFLKDAYQMTPTTMQKTLAYELLQVEPPAKPVQGRMRMAVEADLSFLPGWEEHFIIDCKVPEASDPELRERCVKTAKRFVENRSGVIWEDAHGVPVSMCRKIREASFGVSVAGVYTPSEFRGHGYASHLVAAFSQRLLDGGAPRCLLFTDAENPTSNAIYQRIGYRYSCDFCRVDY